MNKHLLSALVVGTGALMACTTQVGSDEGAIGADESALAIGTGVGTTVPIDTTGTVGGTGTVGTSSLVAPKAPRVLSRSASGSSLVFNFDRVVTAAEIPLASMHVDVVRRTGGQFVSSNVFQSAVLAANGKSLTMNLKETVQKGTAYYARGNWKRCVTLPIFGTTCKTFPAEFGQVIASRVKSVLVNGTVFADVSQAVIARRVVTPASSFDASRISKVTVADAAPPPALPAAGPGTFRVASMNPIEGSQANTRDLRSITVQFSGGTIDCTKILPGEAGFKLYSRSPDVGAQQLMYPDPAARNPTDWGYRGDLRCQEAENRVIFTTPGLLFGDVQYMLEATFASKEGDTLTVQKDFYTERPGIQANALRIDNQYGSHDTCDSDGWFSDNYCDVYVTIGSATASVAQTTRIPETGDFSEMRDLDNDPVNGTRSLGYPGKQLFSTTSPVGVAVELDLMAHDADSTTGWKKFLEVAGSIATGAGAAILAVEPEIGAISAAVGQGLTKISDAIPTNEDDVMGNAKFSVTRDQNRWGTTVSGGVVKIPLDNTADDNRGPVTVWVQFIEYPAPWSPPSIIL